MKKKPKDLETFLDLLRQEGCEIKRGKRIAVKGRAQKGFIRLDSLHVCFQTHDLMQILENAQKSPSVQHTPGKRQRIDLLIDLQAKIQEGKGACYQHWAKVFNLKQIAKVLLFLQENDIHDYEQLERLAKEKNAEFAQYRAERERMRNLANARRNAEKLLKEQGENGESKDRKQIK